MDYYVFASTAIPALWVALGLLKPADPTNKRAAFARSALRLVLAVGEVSAVTIAGVGHDGYLGAVATALALIVGAGALIARTASADLAALGIAGGRTVQAAVGGYLVVLIFAFASYR